MNLKDQDIDDQISKQELIKRRWSENSSLSSVTEEELCVSSRSAEYSNLEIEK